MGLGLGASALPGRILRVAKQWDAKQAKDNDHRSSGPHRREGFALGLRHGWATVQGGHNFAVQKRRRRSSVQVRLRTQPLRKLKMELMELAASRAIPNVLLRLRRQFCAGID